MGPKCFSCFKGGLEGFSCFKGGPEGFSCFKVGPKGFSCFKSGPEVHGGGGSEKISGGGEVSSRGCGGVLYWLTKFSTKFLRHVVACF